MSFVYTPTPVMPTGYTLPNDGELADVASVNVPLEALADGVAFLNGKYSSLDGRPFRNLRTPIAKDTSGASFDFSYTRPAPDGSCTAFWSNTYNLWVKCGNNTAGRIYVGDSNAFNAFDTGATSPPKVSFGCDSATPTSPGRVCVFDSGSVTANPKYILGPVSGDYAATAWTTSTLDSGTFLSYVRPHDCVVTPTQRIIVVGGGDVSGIGQFLAWKSDDFGATFSRVTIANVTLYSDYLTRVICGKNGRLVAWNNESSANLGNVLWYSDDNGNTWSSRTVVGLDHIGDGAYLPDLDKWFFVSGTSIYVTSDPVLGAFTPTSIGIAATTLGGLGHYLMYAQSVAFTRPEVRLSVDGMATTGFVGRETLTGQAYRHIATSPYGQFLLSGTATLTLTEKS